MSKLRPLGDVTQDLENVLIEMAINHDLQWGEILSLVHGYMMVHLPQQQEQYTDGTTPVFFYGPKEDK